MAARKTAKQWNEGMTGVSRPAAGSPVVERCTVDGCGQAATAGRSPRGWVRTAVSESTEPARVWCCGRCAAVGIALAELRMVRP
ncbi:hypothetical protein [Embleya hyalina]|uniref:Uncharacterized protein n=1 Tax=Embleya hyalina TaxID=516124 RepID=A0A401YHF4_9ACTN|nr:hypothetical protein [Embleya hyalina]GCD94045.1 hypothetical protein EHYA_01701 [Embleya hyalina]